MKYDDVIRSILSRWQAILVSKRPALLATALCEVVILPPANEVTRRPLPTSFLETFYHPFIQTLQVGVGATCTLTTVLTGAIDTWWEEAHLLVSVRRNFKIHKELDREISAVHGDRSLLQWKMQRSAVNGISPSNASRNPRGLRFPSLASHSLFP